MSTSNTLPDANVFIKCVATDDRPTLIVRAASSTRQCSQATIDIVFRNDALETLLPSLGVELRFNKWLEDILFDEGQSCGSTTFQNLRWSWRSLGSSYFALCCQSAPSAHSRAAEPFESSFKHDSRNSYLLRVPYLQRNPYVAFFTDYPWSSTPLGPIRSWHPVLRQFVPAMLACPHPRSIMWGQDFKVLYNYSMVPISRAAHPSALGWPNAATWGRELADAFLQTIHHGSVPPAEFSAVDRMYLIERAKGELEEAYFTYSSVPLCDPDGHTLGYMIDLVETTNAILLKERTMITNKSAHVAEMMTNPLQLWSKFATVVNPADAKDFVFAMLYTIEENVRAVSESFKDDRYVPEFRVQQSWGISDPNTIRNAPQLLQNAVSRFPNGDEDFITLEMASKTLPKEFMVAVGGGTVNTVYAFRIDNYNGRHFALAVLGVNPFRACDTEMLHYVQDLQQIYSKRVKALSRPIDERTDEMAFLYRDASMGFFKLRPDGHPVFLNRKYLELMGLQKSDFEGPSGNFAWLNNIHEDDRGLTVDAWEHLVAAGSGVWEYRVSSHGSEAWVECQAFGEQNEHGEMLSVYGWISDITHRKQYAKLMADKLTGALEAKTAATRFIDIVSHEIRNPLGSILQLNDNILSIVNPKTTTITPEEALSIVDAAKTIDICAQHQKTIVDDILTLSKLDSELVELSFDSVQVRPLLEKVTKMVDVDVSRARIELTVNLGHSVDDLGVDFVLLDTGRLLQVLLNLLTNAIKFTRRETKARKVSISLEASSEKPDGTAFDIKYLARNDQGKKKATTIPIDGDEKELWLEFAVSDTGPGMTQEEASHLFTHFAQASARTYKQYGGSGLGLMICRQLSELFGGQIGLRTVYGVGTTVAFYLKTKHAPPPAPDPQPVENPALPDSTSTRTSIANLNILLVEDNAINQRVMAQQLRKTGCTVGVAGNGVQALEHLSRTPVSLILMDVEMPIMDGLTCTRRIRAMEAAGAVPGHVPIIAITANSRREQIATARDAGVDDVVTKPFRIPAIVARVEALAAKWNVSTTTATTTDHVTP